jgi:leucyl/phenylalanyl-tRNA--protein transferase
MHNLPWLEANSIDFPSVSTALSDPNGLLAAGGALTPRSLIKAYSLGIFPWFEEDQPILWWSPSPRLVLYPNELHVSKSLNKILKRQPFRVTTNQCFHRVMQACAEPRLNQEGTWITDDMLDAYQQLHERGFAHSVEVWDGETLVGGLYGIAMGNIFFGESMFSRQSNASKIGFVTMVSALQKQGYSLIDCQVHSEHLSSLGAREIPRSIFCDELKRQIKPSNQPVNWINNEDLQLF